MEVTLQDPQKIFEQTCQFAVPLYQRCYCWNREEHWKPLWENLEAVADSDDSTHFLGAIVVHLQQTTTGRLQVRNIVDGQQRLATLQILMAALRCVAVEAEALDSQYHIERLLVNDTRIYKDDDRLKVLPTTGDRDLGRPQPYSPSIIKQNLCRLGLPHRFFLPSCFYVTSSE